MPSIVPHQLTISSSYFSKMFIYIQRLSEEDPTYVKGAVRMLTFHVLSRINKEQQDEFGQLPYQFKKMIVTSLWAKLAEYDIFENTQLYYRKQYQLKDLQFEEKTNIRLEPQPVRCYTRNISPAAKNRFVGS